MRRWSHSGIAREQGQHGSHTLIQIAGVGLRLERGIPHTVKDAHPLANEGAAVSRFFDALLMVGFIEKRREGRDRPQRAARKIRISATEAIGYRCVLAVEAA